MEKRNYLAKIDFDDAEKNVTQFFCNSCVKDKFGTVDNFIILNGQRMKIQRIGKTVLTGDEEWYYDSESKSYYFYQFNKFCNDITGIYDKMLCTHFRWVKRTNELKYGEFQGDADNKIMFKFDKENQKNGDINNFKRWLNEQFLNNSPVEIYYILQYPEISFYKSDYNPLPRFKFTSHQIITDNDLSPNTNTSYYMYFDSLIK